MLCGARRSSLVVALLATPRGGALALHRSPPALSYGVRRAAATTMSGTFSRKPGVSAPDELSAFVSAAGSDLIVVDVRNPDFAAEPGDAKSNEKAPIGDPSRSAALNVVYDRAESKMDLSALAGKEAAPIITHCGGGGRGQKAKDYLLANGFTNVLNGGGPEDAECWAVFGAK